MLRPAPCRDERARNRNGLQGEHLAEPRIEQNCGDGRYRLCKIRRGG
jgi:hypothetical protein